MYVQVVGCVSRARRAMPVSMNRVPAWKAQDWREIQEAERARERARRAMLTGQVCQSVSRAYSGPAARLMAVMGG